MKATRDEVEWPGPVRRVVFTCDFLRFSISPQGYNSFQPRNLVWLTELLLAAGDWQGRGVEVREVMPPLEVTALERAVANAVAWADYRDDPDFAWARRYDVAPLDVFPGLFDQLQDCDLVVGFELPPSIKRFLHARRRPYLSFYIHPLRFLRDLCFGATTNAKQIADLLRTCSIPQTEIDRQVRRFRALFLRRQLPSCAFPPGLPVLVGQTERDSVLIRDGRFDRWEQHGEELNRRLAPYDALVFLEHPSRPSSAEIVEYLRSVHGKTVIATNANGYGVLFSNRQIPEVLTLASSLGVEAGAIGWATHFLLNDPRRKFQVEGVDLPGGEIYGHAVIGSQFWQALLGGDKLPDRRAAKSQAADAFVLGESYLRNSLDAWSYRPLQFGLDGLGARKLLAPSDSLGAPRRDQLLAGMMGFDGPPSVSPHEAVFQAQSAGLQLHMLEPPIELGEERAILPGSPTGAPYLAGGFHSLESWGVWSGELQARMAFPVARDAVTRGGVLSVALQLSVFGALLPTAPVLRVSQDDRALAYVFFRPLAQNMQSVFIELPVKAPIVWLDFELSGLERPAAKGDSPDTRWLGFAVHNLVVSCGEHRPTMEAERGCQLYGIGPAPVKMRAGSETLEANA